MRIQKVMMLESEIKPFKCKMWQIYFEFRTPLAYDIRIISNPLSTISIKMTDKYHKILARLIKSEFCLIGLTQVKII